MRLPRACARRARWILVAAALAVAVAATPAFAARPGSDKSLTKRFPLGTQTLCCSTRAHPPTSRMSPSTTTPSTITSSTTPTTASTTTSSTTTPSTTRSSTTAAPASGGGSPGAGHHSGGIPVFVYIVAPPVAALLLILGQVALADAWRRRRPTSDAGMNGDGGATNGLPPAPAKRRRGRSSSVRPAIDQPRRDPEGL